MKINYQAKPQVIWATPEVPVLYIDNFYLDPDEVREVALKEKFEQAKAYYPGRHAHIDLSKDENLKAIVYIQKIIKLASGQEIPLEYIETDFSILTVKQSDLLSLQGNPHIDGNPIIALVYLNKEDLGGTNLYRNKVLNKSVIKTEEEQIQLSQFLKDNEGRPSEYITDSNDLWEVIYEIKSVYNRFVCYPGNVFHSINVKKDPSSNDIASQRLTQRIIFNQI